MLFEFGSQFDGRGRLAGRTHRLVSAQRKRLCGAPCIWVKWLLGVHSALRRQYLAVVARKRERIKPAASGYHLMRFRQFRHHVATGYRKRLWGRWSMIPKTPAPDLIPGEHRFLEKIMLLTLKRFSVHEMSDAERQQRGCQQDQGGHCRLAVVDRLHVIVN